MIVIRGMKFNVAKRLCILVVILIFSHVCFASTEVAPLNFDKKDITAMIKKAEPLIEEMTGRNFKKKVKFKIVKREVVRDAVAKAALPIYRKMMKDADEDTVTRQVNDSAAAISQSIFGLYDPQKKSF